VQSSGLTNGNKNLCTEKDGEDDNWSVARGDSKRATTWPITVQQVLISYQMSNMCIL
jgi:hypothetical protein